MNSDISLSTHFSEYLNMPLDISHKTYFLFSYRKIYFVVYTRLEKYKKKETSDVYLGFKSLIFETLSFLYYYIPLIADHVPVDVPARHSLCGCPCVVSSAKLFSLPFKAFNFLWYIFLGNARRFHNNRTYFNAKNSSFVL